MTLEILIYTLKSIQFTGERESFNPEDNVNPILVESLFKEFVSPILLKIFHVRDVQIRIILLR